MKRRIEMKVRVSILCAVALLAVGLGTYLVLGNNQHAHKTSASAVSADSGPLSNATVSFGSWMTSPPLDRVLASPPPANHHELVPQIAKIKVGGTVNFIIAGLHQVIVYDDGTQPADIDITLLSPPAPGTMFPPNINDPDRRIYRGLDPRVLFPTLDRVEVVHFADPGTYLVICGVLPHFQEGMYGYVRVLP
jgi:plastocyanin